MVDKVNMDRKILAVDVCGTLFDANTTAGFVMYHHLQSGNRLRGFLIRLITGRRQLLCYAAILLGKLFRYDVHRMLTLLSLRGQTRIAMESSASRYVDVLKNSPIAKVHQLVEHMRGDGWEPILVSNGIEIVIGEIAKQLGVPCVSSQMAWHGDVCQGSLAVDLTGKKRKYLEKWIGTCLKDIEFAVVTDNKSDCDLIEMAFPAFLVAKGMPREWMESHHAKIISY